jgi:predicted neuraminidase
VRDDPHWNPVLFKDKSGTLHLFFKVGKQIPSWETWTIASHDQGRSWSEPRELVPGDRGGRGPVKNKPIILSDGVWLAPGSVEEAGWWWGFADRSCDGGRTWEMSSPASLDKRMAWPGLPVGNAVPKAGGVIQPTLWESAPGQVHMLLRSTCGAICRSDSMDGGRTWSQVQRTALPNNNSGLDLVRLEGGTLALLYNPTGRNWGPRSPLTLSLSFDNGHTWPERHDVEKERGCEFSYPAIIATGSGVAFTYTWKRQRIVFGSAALESR